jgi:hypothetical protein
MMAKKPRMLVAVTLANRMARVAWALMAKGPEFYREKQICRVNRKPTLSMRVAAEIILD